MSQSVLRQTPLDILSRMSSDAIAAKLDEIARLKAIADQVVKRRNGGLANPAAAGQLLNILIADVSAKSTLEGSVP